MRVYVNVPEVYSEPIAPGVKATMEVASLANRQFGGAVARTSHAIGMNSRTLLTEVDVPNPKGELFPGAYAQVHFHLPLKTVPLVLPDNTVLFQARGPQVSVVNSQRGCEAVTYIRKSRPLLLCCIHRGQHHAVGQNVEDLSDERDVFDDFRRRRDRRMRPTGVSGPSRRAGVRRRGAGRSVRDAAADDRRSARYSACLSARVRDRQAFGAARRARARVPRSRRPRDARG